MNTKQRRKRKNIIIWRDSVAAGDDFYPAHERRIKAEGDETVKTILEKILATHYLPFIIGGRATWIAVGKYPLAVIAQQWSKPYYLVERATHIEELIDRTSDHDLEFRYWNQVEPNKVITCIKHGKPLPDRFGRD